MKRLDWIETKRVLRHWRRHAFPSCASTLHGNKAGIHTARIPYDIDVGKTPERNAARLSDTGRTAQREAEKRPARQAVIPGIRLATSRELREAGRTGKSQMIRTWRTKVELTTLHYGSFLPGSSMPTWMGLLCLIHEWYNLAADTAACVHASSWATRWDTIGDCAACLLVSVSYRSSVQLELLILYYLFLFTFLLYISTRKHMKIFCKNDTVHHEREHVRLCLCYDLSAWIWKSTLEFGITNFMMRFFKLANK